MSGDIVRCILRGTGEGEESKMAIKETCAERLGMLRLSLIPGIGPRTLTNLLDHFHGAEGVWAASSEKLAEVPRLGSRTIAALRRAVREGRAEEVTEWCEQRGIEILAISDAHYPRNLKDMADTPPILYSQGTPLASDALAIAIVGSRHATNYGIRQAGRIARDLARAGVTVVSGLARGIDAAAHRGALEVGGRTIAVLGCGLANIYPPEHDELAIQIAASGCVLSEYSPESQPKGSMFPQRNRIISGLSLGVLVVEAADRSGSLITARHAGEQGREVFALPGPVTSRVSKGCHRLIRDGAQLVTCAEDILEHLGPATEAITLEDGSQIHQPGELLLNEQERLVLDAIEREATAIDVVIRSSKLPVHRVLATISVLETRRLIRRLSNQYVARI